MGWASETEPSDFYLWDVEAEQTSSDADEWQSYISPTDPNAGQSFLGVTEGPEDLHVNPEDMDLEVEDLQADSEDWDIQSEPD